MKVIISLALILNMVVNTIQWLEKKGKSAQVLKAEGRHSMNREYFNSNDPTLLP